MSTGNYLTDENYTNLSREDLIKVIKDLKLRILLVTDFNQSELDERNFCEVCDISYHPDYCHKRFSGKVVCDVCISHGCCENRGCGSCSYCYGDCDECNNLDCHEEKCGTCYTCYN